MISRIGKWFITIGILLNVVKIILGMEYIQFLPATGPRSGVTNLFYWLYQVNGMDERAANALDLTSSYALDISIVLIILGIILIIGNKKISKIIENYFSRRTS